MSHPIVTLIMLLLAVACVVISYGVAIQYGE